MSALPGGSGGWLVWVVLADEVGEDASSGRLLRLWYLDRAGDRLRWRWPFDAAFRGLNGGVLAQDACLEDGESGKGQAASVLSARPC